MAISATLLLASAGAGIDAALSVTYYVDTGGWYDGDPSPATYHPSSTPIQSCINNASSPAIIMVFDGVYHENVVVNQTVTLRSYDADPSNCTIQAASTNDHVIRIASDSVAIEGLTLTGAWDPYQSSGVFINGSDNCAVSNCVISSCIYGVWVHGSNDAKVWGNHISNTTYYGILHDGGTLADIYGNTLSGCIDGISAWSGASIDVAIRQNNITGGKYGIWVYNSQRTNVTGNRASSCANYGIFVDSSVNTTRITYNVLLSSANNTYDKGTGTWDRNYYSDYSGPDSNHDDIGDVPYNVTGGPSQDLHPVVSATAEPSITGLSPANGAVTNNTLVPISASFSSGGFGIDVASAQLLINGSDVTAQATVSASGIAYVPASALPDGPVTVRVSVSDNIGNDATATASWTINTKAAAGGGIDNNVIIAGALVLSAVVIAVAYLTLRGKKK